MPPSHDAVPLRAAVGLPSLVPQPSDKTEEEGREGGGEGRGEGGGEGRWEGGR